jgi:hypothetical protein
VTNPAGRKHRLIRALAALALGCISLGNQPAVAASAGTFAGVPVVPGGTMQANVPLSPLERSYAAEAGNVVPAQAVAVLAVPQNFDPTKVWPVLVPLATDDFKRKNRDDLKDFYRPDAIAEGWIVLAGDGPEYPGHGTSGWRAGMTLAALDALHRSFPGSKDWPVAVAGFSGGSKQTGLLAPLFSVAGCKIIGLFLSGITVDKLSVGYRTFPPGIKFLHTPVFISSGLRDTIATPMEQREVKRSIEKTGFDRVRLENFQEGHAVKRTHIHAALRWFRQLAGY